ncbi:MAG: glycosyltransferase [Lachnospiraceae bacterium]|nr:glycosyltransferase [Lachnospiraceae bacterium]
MLPISVCIIAKNEEQHIEECLRKIKLYHYEIVLVDTGSTDKTVELAAKYTNNIYHFDWINDFSAAKNFAVSKATNDWILSIDCDEYLENIDETVLQKQMSQSPQSAGRILIRNRLTENGQVSYEQVRVTRFFNRKYFHFEGAIHEQVEKVAILPSDSIDAHFDAKTPKPTYPAPITVLHVGYDGSEDEMRAKSLRNIELLEQELNRTGPDAYLYYQLGQSFMKLKDYGKAYEWFNLGLSMDINPELDYVQTMVESYGYCLLDLKRYEEALQLLNIYDVFAVTADFVFLMGLIYMNNGLFDNAIQEFQKSTTMERFSTEGINSYRANYNIGVIYECTGHKEEAKKYYNKCGEYELAKNRLREL